MPASEPDHTPMNRVRPGDFADLACGKWIAAPRPGQGPAGRHCRRGVAATGPEPTDRAGPRSRGTGGGAAGRHHRVRGTRRTDTRSLHGHPPGVGDGSHQARLLDLPGRPGDPARAKDFRFSIQPSRRTSRGGLTYHCTFRLPASPPRAYDFQLSSDGYGRRTRAESRTCACRNRAGDSLPESRHVAPSRYSLRTTALLCDSSLAA